MRIPISPVSVFPSTGDSLTGQDSRVTAIANAIWSL